MELFAVGKCGEGILLDIDNSVFECETYHEMMEEVDSIVSD